jgi:hypothetical protein
MISNADFMVLIYTSGYMLVKVYRASHFPIGTAGEEAGGSRATDLAGVALD